MKKIYLFIAALLLAATCTQAQILEYYSARDLLEEATQEAKSAFASDAYIVNVFFGRITANGVSLDMKKDGSDAGNANGWVYHFYSPSMDANEFFVGLKITTLGTTFVTPPPGSVPPLPFERDAELTNPWVDSPGALGGAKQGGAGQYLAQNPNAEILTAVVLYNPFETQIAPQGKFWVMQFGNETDTLTCGVYAESGAPYQCGVLTAIKGIPEANGFRLDQNYPNPVSLSLGRGTSIDYAIAERQNVRLALYNALGSRIATLYNGVQGAGEYRIHVNSGLIPAPGMYFYRLETSRGIGVHRMIVVK